MLNTRNKKRDNGLNVFRPRGFTLIELMVTIAIAAVMFALALPALGDFVRNNRRASAVNEFMATANLARAEALRRASRVSVCRTNDPTNAAPTCGAGSGWEEGWIVFHDQNGDSTWDAGEAIIKVNQALSGDITIRGNANIATLLAFAPSGALAGVNNGTLVICDSRGYGANARQIVASATGRLRSQVAPSVGTCTP
jgi:type IV fimbrial biogenesis protein FimT